MKINEKILNIPPYISTSWKNIKSLSTEINSTGILLIVKLIDHSSVSIPYLNNETIEQIFDCHARFIEENSNTTPNTQKASFGFGLPLDPELPLEGMKNAMQHNPDQSNAPDIPDDILKKIVNISKIIGSESFSAIGDPVEGCNCIYCQIAKALKNQNNPSIEEEVSDEDLRFREWDIKEIGEKLYLVTNPLDEKEQYRVFLGEPLGCTCGRKNCEHIKAVLSS